MTPEIQVVDDIAEAFAALVIKDFTTHPDEVFNMVVSGGPTARMCYERLALRSVDKIRWWDVDVYWGDERCVPPDDEDSNELLVRQALLERVGGVQAAYPMRCSEGPQAYQLKIAGLASFDLVHLGMGPDGHTASLFAGSDALDADPGQLVVMSADPNGVNPHQRMTLTLSAISKARHVVFTVSGVTKRDAMVRILGGEDLPASRVTAEQITWLVDNDAFPS